MKQHYTSTMKFIRVVIVQSLCLTLCNPMDCNTLGSSVLYDLSEFAPIHAH